MAFPNAAPMTDAEALLSPKFSPFTITSTPYKTVDGQGIPVHVCLPKSTTPGKHPVMVRFHGGFLITGAALFPDFTAQWALDYATLHSAILVLADYRLLPESNGLDVLEDLKDFWAWIRNDLSGYLQSIGSTAEPDLEHILAHGESAGGYLALQTALTVPGVKAVIAAYPMVDVDSEFWSKKAGQSPFGAPEVPREVLEKHIADAPKGVIVTGAYPPARLPIALGAVQHGLFTEWLGAADELYPLRVLDKVPAGKKVPFLFTFHGTDDSAVPYTGTKLFVAQWQEKFGDDSVKATFMPGEHGVDVAHGLEEPWLKEGLDEVTKAWLS